MVETLLNTLLAGLQLWGHKEKTKYSDELMSLRKEYYDEYNKPPEIRSDAVLDNLEFRMCILADSFSASVRTSVASGV